MEFGSHVTPHYSNISGDIWKDAIIKCDISIVIRGIRVRCRHCGVCHIQGVEKDASPHPGRWLSPEQDSRDFRKSRCATLIDDLIGQIRHGYTVRSNKLPTMVLFFILRSDNVVTVANVDHFHFPPSLNSFVYGVRWVAHPKRTFFSCATLYR